MPQMYKVFFKDKLVLLSDEKNFEINLLGFLYVKYQYLEELAECIEVMKSTAVINGIVFFSNDLEGLWQDFNSLFKNIDAAGGVVTNRDKAILMIYRNEIWDLPKGKLEEGEQIEEAALREVKEECGITDLQLSELITRTYHTYPLNEDVVLKCTHWFRMTSEQKDFIPQLDEGISKVEWKKLDSEQLGQMETFENIRLVIEASGLI
jgi:8-oxo-dGTP pyrophosphatase MutT (NUDIX family)